MRYVRLACLTVQFVVVLCSGTQAVSVLGAPRSDGLVEVYHGSASASYSGVSQGISLTTASIDVTGTLRHAQVPPRYRLVPPQAPFELTGLTPDALSKLDIALLRLAFSLALNRDRAGAPWHPPLAWPAPWHGGDGDDVDGPNPQTPAGFPRRPEDWLRVIVKTDDLHAAVDAGLVPQARINRQVAGVIPAGRLDDLLRVPSVEHVAAPSHFTRANDLGRGDARVPEATQAFGVTGSGVIVGIVDSGIDFTHPAFRHPDGTTRLKGIFDIAFPGDLNADGVLDGPIGGGTVFSTAEINDALRRGNGRAFRSAEIGIVAPDQVTGFEIEVSDRSPVDSLHLQIHLEHPDLAQLQVVLLTPSGAQAPLNSLSQATQSMLQATYRVNVPTGTDAIGTWRLVISNSNPDEPVLLYSWALFVNRIIFQEDLNGHGTHVAGSAAGNGASRSAATALRGVAPDADILAVRAERNLQGFDDDDLLLALAWLEQQATTLGKALVTNLSLGGHFGPHDGSTPIELAIDSLAADDRPGRAVVVSAGNEGDEAMHAGGALTASDDRVPLAIQPRGNENGVGSAEVTLWLQGQGALQIGLEYPDPGGFGCLSFEIDPAGTWSNPQTDCANLGRLRPGNALGLRIVDEDANTANLGLIAWSSEPGGVQAILTRWIDTPRYWLLPGAWSLRIRGFNGRWDAWSEGCRPLARCDTRMTVGMPGTSRAAITVGAHTTRANWTDVAGQVQSKPVALNDLAAFSSHGPTRDARAKPDLTAPGQFIASVRSAMMQPCPYLDVALCLDPRLADDLFLSDDYWLSKGTSMAAPIAAGAAALLLQVDPALNAAGVKDLLRQGARRDAFTGPQPAPDDWGAGKLDVESSIRLLQAQNNIPPGSRSVAVAGLRFFAETTDVSFVRQPIGVGTFEDPIVLYEAISGPDPIVRVEGITKIENRANCCSVDPSRERAGSFWLKMVVQNDWGTACTHVDHEIQSVLRQPSDNADGLSFAQSDASVRPFTSDRFTQVIEETELRDFVNFSGGTLPPAESAFFKVVISQVFILPSGTRTGLRATDLGAEASVPDRGMQSDDVNVFYLLQSCNRIPATPGPTPIVSATPTARPPATPTPPPPSETPRSTGPSKAFLPVMLNKDRGCPPKDLFTDVAIVLDASTSMAETVPGGRRKFELAIESARAFVDGMRLNEGGPSDQIALVTFNETSTILQQLTPSRSELHAALDRFTAVRKLSRIELGISTATVHVVGRRHRTENRPVIVLISDGQANPVPGAEAVQAATDAREAFGILIYVIGIGPSIDEAVLKAIATDASRYFFVPDIEQLRSEFAELASTKIPCARENYWPSYVSP